MAGDYWVTNVVHVTPLNDLKPHIEAGEWCHCKPRIEREDGAVIVVHNAYDGREFYEEESEKGQRDCVRNRDRGVTKDSQASKPEKL